MPRKSPRAVTVAQVAAQIDRNMGNLTAIAKQLGVSRNTVSARVKESPILADQVRSARESMIDAAESVLYRKVLEGDMDAVKFFLRTQGKSRGYNERQEVVAAVAGMSVDEWRRGAERRLEQANEALALLGTDDGDTGNE